MTLHEKLDALLIKRDVSSATILYENVSTTQPSSTYTFEEDCDLCVAFISGSNNQAWATGTFDLISSTAKELVRLEKTASYSNGVLTNPIKFAVLQDLKQGDKINFSWVAYGICSIIKLG